MSKARSVEAREKRPAGAQQPWRTPQLKKISAGSAETGPGAGGETNSLS